MNLTDDPLDLAALLAQTGDPECGALVVFGGTVRLDDGVRKIDYSAYAPLAEKVLAGIERETCARFGARHCRILHRLGTVALGELSVLVVVRAPHRPEAFEAARYAIEELKRRAPVWKEEFTQSAARFVDGVVIAEAP